MTSSTMRDLAAADPAAALSLDAIDAAVWADLCHRIVSGETNDQRDVGWSEVADPSPVRVGTTAKQSPHWRRRAVLAGAAAVLLGAIPVVSSLRGGPVGASAQAATLLDRAIAATIAASDERAAGPGQFWKVTATGSSINGYESAKGDGTVGQWLEASTSVSYVPVDQTVVGYRTTTQRVVKQMTGSEGMPAPRSNQFEELVEPLPAGFTGAWQVPTDAWLASVPRDVKALRERLYRDAEGHGPSDDGEVLVLAIDALLTGRVPVDLRRSLYQVLKTVPGVDVTSKALTPDGRTGWGLSRSEVVNRVRSELVIDPGTGALIGVRQVLVEAHGGLAAGTILSETSLTTAVVDSVPADLVRRATAGHTPQNCSTDADGAIRCSPKK